MKKIYILLIALILLAFDAYQQQGAFKPGKLSDSLVAEREYQKNDTLQSAYKNGQSDLQVQGESVVLKVLRDDTEGSRHQRFIIKSGAEQTVLVAHNIDLAPRVAGLKKGDRIAFYGEYEWNSKGGVIHWTHKDPKGRHISGWLKHNGQTYQ